MRGTAAQSKERFNSRSIRITIFIWVPRTKCHLVFVRKQVKDINVKMNLSHLMLICSNGTCIQFCTSTNHFNSFSKFQENYQIPKATDYFGGNRLKEGDR